MRENLNPDVIHHITTFLPVELTDTNIREAVNLWFMDQSEAMRIYGHISDWDTFNITNMSYLFKARKTFNDIITNWKTINVVNMCEMFAFAESFDQDLNFDTRNVRTAKNMFYGATSFNGNVNFNTQNLIDASGMFRYAVSFDKPVNFDTHNVKNMEGMFAFAKSFNQCVNFEMSSYINEFNIINSRLEEPSPFNTTSIASMSFMFNIFNNDDNNDNYNLMNDNEQPLEGFDLTDINTMVFMYHLNPIKHRQPRITIHNIASVSKMFYHATSFDIPLNLRLTEFNMTYI